MSDAIIKKNMPETLSSSKHDLKDRGARYKLVKMYYVAEQK
jgi:hypothetical protein